MNPLYVAAAVGAALARRKCPACGARSTLVKGDKGGTYRCKKCGQRFTQRELSKS